MSFTGASDQMKSDWPHRKYSLRGPFLVTEVRWFMIYFPITPSVLCALGPHVNKGWASLSPCTFPPTSIVEAFVVLPASCWAKLGKASTVFNTAYLYTFMSGNWNTGRDGGEIKKLWMTELRWCWSQCEAGRLCTPGPPRQMVRGWGLHNTRLSHMSPNHTRTFRKPIVRLQMRSKWDQRANVFCSLIPDQVLSKLLLCVCLNRRITGWWCSIKW